MSFLMRADAINNGEAKNSMKKTLLFIIGLWGITVAPMSIGATMSVARPLTTAMPNNTAVGFEFKTTKQISSSANLGLYVVYPHTCTLSVSYPEGISGVTSAYTTGVNVPITPAKPYSWVSPAKEQYSQYAGPGPSIYMGGYLYSLTNTTGTTKTGKVTYTMSCSDGRSSSFIQQKTIDFSIPGDQITSTISPDSLSFTGRVNNPVSSQFKLSSSNENVVFTVIPGAEIAASGKNVMCEGTLCFPYTINGTVGTFYTLGAGTHTVSFTPTQAGTYTGSFSVTMSVR